MFYIDLVTEDSEDKSGVSDLEHINNDHEKGGGDDVRGEEMWTGEELEETHHCVDQLLSPLDSGSDSSQQSARWARDQQPVTDWLIETFYSV